MRGRASGEDSWRPRSADTVITFAPGKEKGVVTFSSVFGEGEKF